MTGWARTRIARRLADRAGARRLAQRGAALLCVLLAAPAVAQPVPAAVAASGTLWFDAEATLGDFRGTTRTLRGAITGGDSIGQVRGHVEFDARTLETGNGLRDRDMRGSLEVEKHPVIRFDLDSAVVRVRDTDSATVSLFGRMAIHGTTRAIEAPATLYREAASVRVTGGFVLNVTEYGIGGLKKMFGMLSMNEVIRVGFDVTFTPAEARGEESRCAMCTPQ